MIVSAVVPQLHTTDLDASIHFYVDTLGFALAFRYQDFYAGIRASEQVFHLKRVDDADPTVAYVAQGGHFHLYFETDDIAEVAAALKAKGVALVQDLHDTAWNTRELVLRDDQGHTLYLGQALS